MMRTPVSEKTHRFVGGRWRRKDRCLQCNRPLTKKQARAEIRRCDECNGKARLYGKDRTAYMESRTTRKILRNLGDEYRVLWKKTSHNEKLGPIPMTIVTPSTCPPSCAFYGNGCYAEFGFLASHWRKAALEGLSFTAFMARVASLQSGSLWRYAVAGDLPGVGDELDIDTLDVLAEISSHTQGFTFTHKPLKKATERNAVRRANRKGFTINLSANSLEHADQRARLGIGPVAVVVPLDHPRYSKTPAGRTVIVCPAQARNDVTCDSCRLCAIPTRKAIIAFRAHGQMAAEMSRKFRLPMLNGAAHA